YRSLTHLSRKIVYNPRRIEVTLGRWSAEHFGTSLESLYATFSNNGPACRPAAGRLRDGTSRQSHSRPADGARRDYGPNRGRRATRPPDRGRRNSYHGSGSRHDDTAAHANRTADPAADGAC